MNVAQHIERARRWFPDKTALLFEGKSFTYRELDQAVNRAANGLRGLGVERGDRVALFMPNIPEFVIAYLAALKIGAIAVSVNALFKSNEVQFVLQDSGARVVVTTETLRPNVPDRELETLEHILIAEGQAHAALLLEEVMSQASGEARAAEMSRNDPAAIVYTSGTTGFPKGAVLSHGNIISNAFSKNHYCGMRPADRMLLFLPLFHCFGQNAILNSGLYACSTIVLQRRFDPELALRAADEEKITMFFGVPTTFIVLLNKTAIGQKLASVRYYLSGGGPLPVEIARRWREQFKIDINIGYGLTETSPFASYNHEFKYKLGSVGTPIENVEMQIIDPDTGQPVPPGERGEIAIRGPNVMLGYWNRPEETAAVLRDGWFRSGDIGIMDEEGYFYVVDRLKDMINVGGLKVYPVEVENVLYQHPAVAEAAVYGIPDALMGERVKASLVLKANQMVSEAELVAFCRQRLADFKVPAVVEFVEALPKNAPGKILKRVLRQGHT